MPPKEQVQRERERERERERCFTQIRVLSKQYNASWEMNSEVWSLVAVHYEKLGSAKCGHFASLHKDVD